MSIYVVYVYIYINLINQVIEEKTLGAEDTNINELRKIRFITYHSKA